MAFCPLQLKQLIYTHKILSNIDFESKKTMIKLEINSLRLVFIFLYT